MRPKVICHMASSLDGRILPERWSPADARFDAAYDDVHDRLGGGSWLVGRVTGQEFAKRDTYAAGAKAEAYPRASWLPVTGAAAYAIMIDADGKIAWGRSDIGGDPIVVLLTERVSDSHLAGLREDGVGYIFAGNDKLDLAGAMDALFDELGIDQLLLEGGGHINGTFLRAGLVDEISLLLVPAIDGTMGAPATFDGEENDRATPLPITKLECMSHEPLANGILWLRYAVHSNGS